MAGRSKSQTRPNDPTILVTVVRVAYGSDRRFDAGFGEPVGVADGQVLAAPIGMMHQPPIGFCRVWSPCPECLLERVESQIGS